jgi:hypothetical protein
VKRVYLDDYREAPLGWIRVFWPYQVVQLLETGEVTHLSLDHDLGDDKRGTGYDVLPEIERMINDGTLAQLPELTVHSANPAARQRMELAIEAIKRQWSQQHPPP